MNRDDIINAITLVCATVITLVAMWILKADAKDIAIATLGGLIGFLGHKAASGNAPKGNPE